MKNVNEITEVYLQELIDNAVSEKKTLEYKESLPGNSESAKKEFLADVSSFSNASGGNLIFGIVEDREKGVPEKIEGLTIENVDQEITRLENMIRDGIRPRISGIEIRSIKVLESKVVLLIRVPRSWNSPHRVTFGGHDKFYTRSTTGKYPMDVTELKVAFNLSETITEGIRRFREDRISKIFANETPVPFYDNAKVVLHLIPIISFNPAQRYDLSRITSRPEKLEPINHCGFANKYNLDGFLTYSENREGKSYSYVQLFNNGIIEAVEGKCLAPCENGGKFLIHGTVYENELIKVLSGYLSTLKEINIELPIFVFLTFVGVRGYFMFVSEGRVSSLENSGIDRDILLLPEVMIENYDTAPEEVLKPCFDALWNACGFPRLIMIRLGREKG
ncbi:MAG: ATP-binding protein [Atribacterota bacterium]|nr:ATP-binding protein [Atribacterota bacterium]